MAQQQHVETGANNGAAFVETRTTPWHALWVPTKAHYTTEVTGGAYAGTSTTGPKTG